MPPPQDTLTRPHALPRSPRRRLASEGFGARLRRRDPEALGEFYDRFFDRVHAYVRRLVKSEEASEDLTHDIFLHVYRALPQYDPSRDLGPWVFTIASNKIRDHWRSRAHQAELRSTALDDGLAAALATPGDRPDEAVDREETRALVRDAVQRLPEGLRRTLELRAFEGLSFEAIGEVLGRNATAVRKRYSRALAALRELLAGRPGCPAPCPESAGL